MKAIVVGAGAGGLVAAWELARAGWVVTVIEAGERPGGLLNRVVVDDLALDVGAEGWPARGGSGGATADRPGCSRPDRAARAGGASVQTASGTHPIPKRLVFDARRSRGERRACRGR